MNLYRRGTLQTSLVLLLASIIGFTVAAAQKRKPHKLRATALVEISTDRSGATTARVVPITILDEGSFHDAGIYKAAPEPMALDNGVVYEAQKTGQPVGYVTVKNASKDKNGNWAALGRWQLVSAPPKAQAPASPVAGGAGSPDGRPMLHRSGSASSTSATPAASPTPSPSDDRPILHRPTADTSTPSTPSPAATPAATPTAAAPPEPEPEDTDRPTLRHRAPRSAQEESTVSPTPAATPTRPAAAAPTTPPRPTASPSAASGGQSLVAVSDAQASDSRSYEFIWKPGEREVIEDKMRHLALAQLPRASGAALTERSLTNVVIRTFDLDLSNDAVVVLTADVPPGSAPAASRAKGKPGARAGARASSPASAAPPAAPVTRYVTLIARVDFEGNPQKLAASVTDSSRLDVAPRLELVDAVDVDGDGLGELLFREYSFDDKSFVIFSIGRGSVTKLFEGASQPLK